MPHGTRARYQRHLRFGDPPCDACRAANTHASQLARKRRAAASGLTVVWVPVYLSLTRRGTGSLEWDGQPPYEQRREELTP
jgi:hypothetical protein